MQTYNTLCTEFYDLTLHEAGEKEISFYERAIRQVNGPVLEAMCGAGRVLIPLLKKRLSVEGVDYSSPMLERCRARCKKDDLDVLLHHQPLQNLALSKKYALIFIAIGSFQLFSDRDEALHVLQKLREHLLPDGILMIDSIIPWEVIQVGIKEGKLISTPVISQRETKTLTPEGYEITQNIHNTADLLNQTQRAINTYEKRKEGKLIASEKEIFSFRWYYYYEFELFLQKAGFSQIETINVSFEDNPRAIIYKAYVNR